MLPEEPVLSVSPMDRAMVPPCALGASGETRTPLTPSCTPVSEELLNRVDLTGSRHTLVLTSDAAKRT